MSRARLAGTAALATGGIGLISMQAARAAAARIEGNPDPFPRDQLAREPEGQEVFIDRPDGTVLRAVVAGRGPTVVLAHGFCVSLQEWNIVWEPLIARGYRVIAFDQRGHGRSTIGSAGIGSEPMADDYGAVLEHFDVHGGVLVGHSMGGFIAIRAVLDSPDVAPRLGGLVLFATWAGALLEGAPQNRAQLPLLRLGVLQRWARTKTGGVLFGAMQCGKTPSPVMISVFNEVFAQQNHQPLLPIVQAFMREDRYRRLGEITLPTVVMVGSADRTTPPHHAQRLAAGIPDARLITIPDAGHLLNWECGGPEALVDAITSLHQKLPTGSTAAAP